LIPVLAFGCRIEAAGSNLMRPGEYFRLSAAPIEDCDSLTTRVGNTDYVLLIFGIGRSLQHRQ
jgi:hypothetical protein